MTDIAAVLMSASRGKRLKLKYTVIVAAMVAAGCSSSEDGGAVVDDAGSSGSMSGDASAMGTDGTDMAGTDNVSGTDSTDTAGTDGTDTAGTDGTDTAGTDSTDAAPPAGVPILGNGKNSINFVQVASIANATADALKSPRDVAVNPHRPTEAWIVNYGSDSVTVVHDYATEDRYSEWYWSFGSAHFCVRPSGIAFGDTGIMATIHEMDKQTQGPNGTPADFMGPTMQATDLATFDAGHGSHLDMLHNSPNGMGIAWETANAYWVFDGYHSSLTRYDFKSDHGMGGSDHSDGVITRYAEGQVKRVEQVSSNMQYDPSSGLLYVADTGNGRIATLDTQSGSMGGSIGPNYDGCVMNQVGGATVATFIEGADFGITHPSGLVMQDGLMLVADNATGYIHAFDMEGEQLDWMDAKVGPGALNGIDMDDAGNLLVVDTVKQQVYMITALPAQ